MLNKKPMRPKSAINIGKLVKVLRRMPKGRGTLARNHYLKRHIFKGVEYLGNEVEKFYDSLKKVHGTKGIEEVCHGTAQDIIDRQIKRGQAKTIQQAIAISERDIEMVQKRILKIHLQISNKMKISDDAKNTVHFMKYAEARHETGELGRVISSFCEQVKPRLEAIKQQYK
ncbi:MAG: hypothetical protein PHD95_06335 [Candidatus ainarchaeum sp.]|nr:hypothetical protein [Candidatus ainarchaeum sp.]